MKIQDFWGTKGGHVSQRCIGCLVLALILAALLVPVIWRAVAWLL
ncbi:MAG TPA: hypothetical protein VNZ53_52255 [Steroidobacteraceae bacterium]|nr:hypothetical protein [Steroidobacteraceae bacterium]